MLMEEWSLPQVLELDEMITIWDAVEEAVHKDNEAKEKRGS
jgi:hypothetical protein